MSQKVFGKKASGIPKVEVSTFDAELDTLLGTSGSPLDQNHTLIESLDLSAATLLTKNPEDEIYKNVVLLITHHPPPALLKLGPKLLGFPDCTLHP